jgi:hypothetical protein
MTTERLLLASILLGLASIGWSQSEPEPLAHQIVKWSEAEQAAWIRSTLDQGIPPDLGGAFGTLVLAKTDLALPLIEERIEQVLKSASPLDLFTDKSVDPQRFVAAALGSIEYVGNEQSLREVAKLLHVDEERFDDVVQRTMLGAAALRNPFPVAYQGFAIGDTLLDTRLAIWADWELAEKRPPFPASYLAKRHYGYASTDPSPEPDAEIQNIRRLWAEALVDRYGGVPSEAQWQGDPIVSRLTPAMAQSFHDDMIRRTSDLVQKRAKR